MADPGHNETMTDPVLGTLIQSGVIGLQALRVAAGITLAREGGDERVRRACHAVEAAIAAVERATGDLAVASRRLVVPATVVPPAPGRERQRSDAP